MARTGTPIKISRRGFARGTAAAAGAAAPAPPKMAVQIYVQATMTKMIARVTTQNESIDKCIDWAQKELEGFKRV